MKFLPPLIIDLTLSIIPVLPRDFSHSLCVLNVYLSIVRYLCNDASRYIREVLFSIVYKQWSLENAFEKKEKENIKRSIVNRLSFIDIFVVATVNYRSVINTFSISFRN